MITHSNLCQGSPGGLRASVWIMFSLPLLPKPSWPLTCLHRLKMWCWNVLWIKPCLCWGATNVSMMKVRALMLYYLGYIVRRIRDGKQVWWMSNSRRHTFLPVSTCVCACACVCGGGEVVGLLSQGVLVVESGNLIQRCLLVDRVEMVKRHSTVWPWEICVWQWKEGFTQTGWWQNWKVNAGSTSVIRCIGG